MVKDVIVKNSFGPGNPVYRPGTTLYDIIIDGVSRSFETSQIIEEASWSGYVIDEKPVDAVRKDFNAQMEKFFKVGCNLE
jgi:hypothetical protein